MRALSTHHAGASGQRSIHYGVHSCGATKNPSTPDTFEEDNYLNVRLTAKLAVGKRTHTIQPHTTS